MFADFGATKPFNYPRRINYLDMSCAEPRLVAPPVDEGANLADEMTTFIADQNVARSAMLRKIEFQSPANFPACTVQPAPVNPITMPAELGGRRFAAIDGPRSFNQEDRPQPRWSDRQWFPLMSAEHPGTHVEATTQAERSCQVCARPLTRLARMRAMGPRPKVTVYRCDGCKRIESDED